MEDDEFTDLPPRRFVASEERRTLSLCSPRRVSAKSGTGRRTESEGCGAQARRDRAHSTQWRRYDDTAPPTILACASTPGGGSSPADVSTAVHRFEEGKLRRMKTVAYRPVDPASDAGQWLVSALPVPSGDAALASAAGELISSLRSTDRLMSPRAMADATARSGFPGAARFGKTVTNGAFPSTVDPIITAAQGMPVDVGIAKRDFANGQVLWVIGWAPHLMDMDPLPRTVPLDSGVTARVDRVTKGDARLFVAPPDGRWLSLSMTSGVARWVDGFDVPGEYRF